MKEELTIDMYYEYRLLKGKIIQCKNAYEENTPIVSDDEYDELVKRVKDIEDKYPILTEVQTKKFREKVYDRRKYNKKYI